MTKHQLNSGLEINTEFVYPPIPLRTMDWQATLDGYDAGDPIGRGATEAEAISDLLDQLEDHPLLADEPEPNDDDMLELRARVRSGV